MIYVHGSGFELVEEPLYFLRKGCFTQLAPKECKLYGESGLKRRSRKQPPPKKDSYELLEENMRRAKNGEHIIDSKTRK